MNYEVEQKFPVADVQRLEQALADLGAVEQPAITQVDTYFCHPARDFAKTDEALRIRRVGDDNFVTYKGPKLDAKTKTRRELELPLATGEAGAAGFVELFLTLGFRSVAEVRKTRRPLEIRWQNRTVHAALDDVASIGAFVELELVVEADEVEKAKTCIASLAEKLQLACSERRSYLELLLERQSK